MNNFHLAFNKLVYTIINNYQQKQNNALKADVNASILKTNTPAIKNALLSNFKEILVNVDIVNKNSLDIVEFNQNNLNKQLKNLLGLPNDIENLLKLLSDTKLKRNVDINKLKSLLVNNVEYAILKLSETSANNKDSLEKTNKILEALNQFLPTNISVEQFNNQVLKNIILLYLPWMPLASNKDFDIVMGAKEQVENTLEEDSILITIITNNFGIIEIFLSLDISDKSKVNMKIACNEEFPKNELKEIIELNSKKYNLKLRFEAEINKSKPLDNNSNNKLQQDIKMLTSSQINPYLLIVAHIVIKQVIQIDNKHDLYNIRIKELT